MLFEQHLSGSIGKTLEGKTQTRKSENFMIGSSIWKKKYGIKKNKNKFGVEEREMLIDFYTWQPSLWNHNSTDYRDRNLRESLLDKLADEFENNLRQNK